MPALVIFSATDDKLNGYRRGDVVAVLPANADPGESVRMNSPQRFGFVYVTDASVDSVSRSLVSEAIDDDASAPKDEQGNGEILAKASRKLNVDAIGADALTYRAANQARAVRLDTDGLTAVVSVKTRAEVVSQAVEVLARKRDAIDSKIERLTASLEGK